MKNKNLQRGWGAIEYIAGAFIILTVIVTVMTLISNAIQTKGGQVESVIAQ